MHSEVAVEIWPAIDLLGGRCVRLRQGDYQQQTVFGDEPSHIAQRWRDEGADRLHLVDLDAAKDGSSVNLASVKAILSQVDFPCQLGGGVRDELTIQRLLDLGLQRLVVGTAALKRPAWFAEMCDRYPQRLCVGIDAKNGMVATDGWLSLSQTPATKLAEELRSLTSNMAAIVYTDIARDGMMAGPNLEQLAQMLAATDVPVVASGGITTLDDVRDVKRLGATGCIIGRTLYEGKLQLGEAIRVSRSVAC
jgi:phosphoribosylformimino-5-aminoimidazole carboxamide ribotide isomerase